MGRLYDSALTEVIRGREKALVRREDRLQRKYCEGYLLPSKEPINENGLVWFNYNVPEY